jgi:glucose-6-phosphate-specific signal transduction histidine kinase
MDQALTAPSLDAGAVLARFRAARWRLGRAILLMRVGVAAAMVAVAARPAGGTRDASLDVAVFAAYLIWTAASGGAGRRLFAAVERRPGLVWIEQALCVCLVVVGGGSRVIALYACALPVIVATVFVSPRQGVALATADAVVVAVVLGGTTLAGVRAGTEPVHTTEWPLGLVGLYIAAGLFAYVRRLFVALEQTGIAYQARSEEIAAAVSAQARTQTRVAALADVAARIGDVIPAIRDHLADLRDHRALDPAWQAECDGLDQLVEHAGTSLAELSAYAPQAAAARTIEEAIQAAIGRVRLLAAQADVSLVTVGCDVPIAGARAAALGRFAEEAAWNAYKHGRPPIAVTATVADGKASVAIRDSGAGFDPGPGTPGLGLDSLHRDAALLGGEVHIDAAPGRPVTVRLSFPAGRDA